jgi:PPOX class probable F420-dependent enzyme
VKLGRVPRATILDLTDDARAFLAERHLATFTTLRGDGTPHVTPVGFTWDEATGTARVITSGTSQKATNARGGVTAVLCQLDGPRWLSLEGIATTSDDPAVVADAVARYARRYRVPRENPKRVAIEIAVTRVLGSSAMLSR